MKQRSLCLVFAAAALVTGCSHFKKNQKPKENPAIAADTDESFQRRYIEKRVAELAAQGMTADLARAQAAEEFKTRYGYTSAAKK